jgi:hypothetical protein
MRMKNSTIPIALCLIACVVLTACDTYAFSRPTAYKETRWVSTDPNIYFEVSEKYDSLTFGELTTNDTIVEMEVLFNMGRRVDFRYLPDEKEIVSSYKDALVFSGECKFGKDKLVVDILSNDAGLLTDDVTQITFVREPLE